MVVKHLLRQVVQSRVSRLRRLPAQQLAMPLTSRRPLMHRMPRNRRIAKSRPVLGPSSSQWHREAPLVVSLSAS